VFGGILDEPAAEEEAAPVPDANVVLT
jgi:hypothetical protein